MPGQPLTSNAGHDSIDSDLDMIRTARREIEAARARDKSNSSAQGLPAAAAFTPPPPETFPGYQILREVHRGGQGVVYHAMEESTSREVALKVMKEGRFAGPADRARFDREVQILRRLNHANIVAIRHVGVAAGSHFLVMDYIHGQPLDIYASSSDMSDLRPMLRLFAKICDAVNAAHLNGVIHRDLKPANIRIDDAGEPHVLDFGLAKTLWLGAPSLPGVGDGSAGSVGVPPENLAMTATGQFIGSLPWASPEQAEGRTDEIDIRTDVYSLGVILYHMLTGRFPYDVRGNMRDVLDRIMTAEPLPPSKALLLWHRFSTGEASTGEADTLWHRFLTGESSTGETRRPRFLPSVPSCLRASVPSSPINNEVETIILKCLAKEPDRRYQSAGELAKDVERYLTGEPIEAKRDSAAYVIRKQLRKHKLPVAVAAAFLMVVFAGLAASLTFWRQAADERDRAEANFQKARDAVDRMLTRVAQDKLAGLPQMEPIRRELLEDALEFYQGFLQEQRENADVQFDTALAYHQVGRLRQDLGDNAEAEQAYRESISLLEAIAADSSAPDDFRGNLAATHNTLGILLTQTGDYANSETAFRRAIEIRSRLADVSPDPAGHLANLSDAHANLGNVFAMTAHMPQAETAYRASLALMERLLRDSPDELYYRQGVASTRASLANLLAMTGRPDDAEPAFRQSIDVQRILVADFPDARSYRVDLARSLSGLADILREANRLDEADQAYGQTVALFQELADDFPAVIQYRKKLADTLMNRAIVLGQGGKLDQAQAAFRHAIELLRKFADEFPEMTENRAALASAYFNLALSLRMAGKLDEAETAFREALALRQALADEFPTFPDHSRQLAKIHGELGIVLTAASRSDEAAEAYRRALTLWEELAVEFPDVHVYKRSLASLLADCPEVTLRDTRRAVALAEKAVELAPQDGESWLTLGTVHYRAGNWQLAVEALKESMRLYAGGDSTDHFFMAMAQWQLTDKQRAREWYDRGAGWMSENHPDDPQRHRLRAEAAQLLGIED